MKIFEIFYRFLLLGLVSFGGPMAHIAYFRDTFVVKLKWLDEISYSKLVALSQFLPGPSSSQVGFAIGLKRAGLSGALAAFLGFTIPSFFILYFLAIFDISQNQSGWIFGVVVGLKLFAVVIVADATIGMFKSFCKSKATVFIFVFSTLVLLFFSTIYTQIFVLIVSAFLGNLFIKNDIKDEQKELKKTKLVPFSIFFILLVTLPFLSNINDELKLFSSFYEAGSLVFGGGHVVLPLLQETLGTMVSDDSFLVGYSLAQGVPGPMFTIASYLGADIFTSSPLLGAILATIAIFLPGFLLILSFYNSFESYTSKGKIINAISGVNAAVVGMLFAVLCNLVFPSAVHSLYDLIFVIMGFVLLKRFKTPIWILLFLFIMFGVVKNLI
ncbi:chromate efflux transporter [Arcobacteraceae bacterium]|nr:chromate efflux transporter [Arcobacteraceae bacterium]